MSATRGELLLCAPVPVKAEVTSRRQPRAAPPLPKPALAELRSRYQAFGWDVPPCSSSVRDAGLRDQTIPKLYFVPHTDLFPLKTSCPSEPWSRACRAVLVPLFLLALLPVASFQGRLAGNLPGVNRSPSSCAPQKGYFTQTKRAPHRQQSSAVPKYAVVA